MILLMEEILHQLRLVAYPTIYKVFCIPGGERRISEPSRAQTMQDLRANQSNNLHLDSILVGGFNPLWKIIVSKLEFHFPNFRGENSKTHLSLPPWQNFIEFDVVTSVSQHLPPFWAPLTRLQRRRKRHGASHQPWQVSARRWHREKTLNDMSFDWLVHTWRIIPFSKWLITMVIVSPQDLGLWDPFQTAELHGL